MPNVGAAEPAGVAPKLTPIVGAATFVDGTANEVGAVDVVAEKLKLPTGATVAVGPPSPPRPPRPPRLNVGAFAVA